MSRLSKFLTFTVVVLFLLACSLVPQPGRGAENLAKTAQAIGSAIPAGTLEALGTSMPDLENAFNPQGTPVQEWKGIPIMPQATAGQEFANKDAYSFKADVTMKEVQDFYGEKLAALGWKQPYDIPSEGDAGLMIFQKGSNILTIAITSSEGSSVVILTLA
ncbi:MAG TPA: hypothetical protein VLE49_04530 [Anaerolineales bacterium]|nr:hypothetical protein [Anaerolineales bacterium]